MIRLRKGLASRIWENLVRPHAAGRRSVPLALLTRSAKWPIVVRARYGAAMQVLAMIGEQFEASDEICGAVLSVRQHEDIVALWTRTAADGLGILAIRCEPHARLPRHAPPPRWRAYADLRLGPPLSDGAALPPCLRQRVW